MNLKALLIPVAMLSSTSCFADACASASNTVELNACAKQQLDEQDKRLNAAYQALLTALPSKNETGTSGDSPRAMLVKAQRKWIEFRDADCNTKYQIYAGGSIRNVVYLGCLRERTEQRIKELAVSAWQEG